MCPDVLQFLTYMAGRTRQAGLGSMVVVLPWHDPMRVAEEVSMLDNISDGRLILGLGRGAGRVEFDGFRLSMDESRERFVESAETLLRGLEAGYCEYAGTFVRQPRAAIRPAPFKTFRGRTYAAAVSPESMPIMAKLGVGILVIPQKPWPEVAKELDAYRTTYREINRTEAPPPVCAGWTFCDENAARAHEMARRYIGGYYQTVLDHYNFQDDHLAKTKGYEYYGKMAEKIQQYGTDKVIEYFMNLQVWGTPEQCYEKILDVRGRVGNDTFVGVFGVPTGELREGLDGVAKQPLWLGTYAGTPCWVAGLPRDAALPEGLHRETLVPMQGTRLPDDLLSLGGMAMQLLYWESTSGHCPRCGTPTERMPGEWGKRCPTCRYEHYPHLHPAVIVLVRDGDRMLLARKAIWAPGRYALVAGFVDNGESLEAAVTREVREEVGVDVKDIRYVGSQNWPFPSQLIVGFVAAYAGGEITVDPDELEDARWFSCDELPDGPCRHPIRGWISANFARR